MPVLLLLGIVVLVFLFRRMFVDSNSSSPQSSIEHDQVVAPLPQSVQSNAQLSTVQRATANDQPAYRIPSPPEGYGPAKWVPKGRAIRVGDLEISGGMVYFGISRNDPWNEPEASLIDPSRNVGAFGDFTQKQTNYWPTYSGLTPAARRSYLNWLADGRRNPRADVGFVFLFFYGLERRVLKDMREDSLARAERVDIQKELTELIDAYGQASGSFSSYAHGLLEWLEVMDVPPKLYDQPPPESVRSYTLPAALKLALGQAAADGVPISAELALYWAKADVTCSFRTEPHRDSRRLQSLRGWSHAPNQQVLPRG